MPAARIKSFIIILLILSLFISITTAQEVEKDNIIQIAILLDTSNSMDGLIDQAKSQLWKIVNELSRAKQNGKSPSLEVALFEYGNTNISVISGYIRQVVSLTNDLDKISEELFNLKTRGGDEYCGQVIEEAVKKLEWSSDNRILKMIFIAGNEEFTQGFVDYKKSCKTAITKGITVNTIFCGDKREGIDTFWKDGADLADGSYINIDQNKSYVYIKAPQDDEILKLNQELNGTYIAFGDAGKEKKLNQSVQDTNAASMSKEAQIQRSVTKTTINYRNSTWDLVDAVNDKTVKLEDVKENELPDEMKKMTLDEKKKYIDGMNKKRSEIQKKISQLNKDRNDYLAEESAKNNQNDTLDNAVIKAVREQAKKKNYNF